MKDVNDRPCAAAHNETADADGCRLNAMDTGTGSCAILSAEGIRAHIPATLRALPLHVFPEVDSTNTLLKRMALEGAPHGTMTAADAQTAGRGRHGRSFFSPAGTGLYMSVLLRPDAAKPFDPQGVTIAAAVAVAEAVERLTGCAPAIKWVNDLYWNGRKFCGILTEAAGSIVAGRVDSVVIGVGVNTATEHFPGELNNVAGSLGLRDLDRNALAAAIWEGLLTAWERAGEASVLDAYRARSFLPGQQIVYSGYDGVPHYALALRIDDAGRLVVREEDGREIALSSGDVSARKA